MRVFSYAVILQSWLAGLFIGKVTTGSFSGGFLYSAVLTVIAMGGALMTVLGMFDVGTMLGGGGSFG